MQAPLSIIGRENGTPRILLTRLDDIGDCVMTLPVLNALRAKFREAFLCWIVEEPCDRILENHPALDRLIVARHGWRTSPREIWRLRRELRQERFDVAFDLQAAPATALLGRLSRARRRIGFAKSKDVSWLSARLNQEHVTPRKAHQIDRQLELLRQLGIRVADVEFSLPEDPKAWHTIGGWIENAHLGCGFAVINPNAGWQRWPTNRFGAVATHLGCRHALPSVVVWSGDAERQSAEEIVSHSSGHAIRAPKTSLAELGALLRRAKLFVGCDTAPMHMAVAVGTTCVALHGTTRPQVNGPYGMHHQTVQAYDQDGTQRASRRATNEAMMAINIDDVSAACDRVLRQQARGPAASRAA